MSDPVAASAPAAPNRILQGLTRGLRRRCPNCGEGELFAGYIKVRPVCASCGADNAQYRADDAGPYFTILIAGHLCIGPMLFFPFIWKAPIAWVLATTLPLLLTVTLVLLPLVKGAVIGVLSGMAANKAQKAQG